MRQEFIINELTCPGCMKKLIENLEKLDNIKEIDINYDEKRLVVEGTRELSFAEIDLIINTVLKISQCELHEQNIFDLEDNNQVTEEFIFENIDCPNCALKVERALKEDDKILDARVNFITKKIIITHLNNTEVFETVARITRKIEVDANVFRINDGVEIVNNSTKIADHHHHDHNEEVRSANQPKKTKYILFGLGVLGFISLVIYTLLSGNKSKYLIIGYAIIYLLIGYDILIKSFKNILKGQIFDENLLMVIASVGALIINEPIEAVLLILLYKIGEWFQDRAVDRSTKSITNLMSLTVDEIMMDDGSIKKIKDIKIGEIIVVKAGEKIPLDGKIVSGATELDTKSLTGESLPKDVKVGDHVLSGCINLNGVIKIAVETLEKDSTISKVMKLIEEASNKKSRTEEFITRFARIYTPIVLALALIIGLAEYFFFGFTLTASLNNVFVFLVVSCPCALVISIPMGFFSGLGRASSAGILVKGGNYLELLTKIDTVIFDKTGTITEGNFKVEAVNGYNGYSESDILEVAATVESFSNHPIARSIVNAYGKTVARYAVTELEELSGHGIKAKYNQQDILVGKKELLEMSGISVDEIMVAGSIVYVAINNEYAGHIIIIDEIKANTKATIEYLHKYNIKTIMLSGDNHTIVKSVQEAVGIDEAHAGLLPDEKMQTLEGIIKEGHNVAYIGDGINDTPAIKLAHVGISMGTNGSDIAKDAADIVIMNDDIGQIREAVEIAKFTRRIIVANIVFALVVKFAALIVGTLGFLGSYGMILGVFADVGVCILAVINTLRILKFKTKYQKRKI